MIAPMMQIVYNKNNAGRPYSPQTNKQPYFMVVNLFILPQFQELSSTAAN